MTDGRDTAFRDLVLTLAAIAGVSPERMLSRSRRPPLPACRWMLGEALMKRGCSSTEAGRMVGLDHASLLYGIRKLDDCRGRWHPESEIYDRFLSVTGHLSGGEEVLPGSNPGPSQVRDCHV